MKAVFFLAISFLLLINLFECKSNVVADDDDDDDSDYLGIHKDVCSSLNKVIKRLECELVDYSEDDSNKDSNDTTTNYDSGSVTLCDITHLVKLNDTCEKLSRKYNFDVAKSISKSDYFDCGDLPVGKILCLNRNSTDDDDDGSTTTEYVEDEEEDEEEVEEYDEEETTSKATTKKASTKAPTSASTAAPAPIMNQLNQEGINAHNEYRKRHGVQPLTYSKKLADYAQKWAEHLASVDKMYHSNTRSVGYGENLAYGYGQPVNGRTASKWWYDEIDDYNFGSGSKKFFSFGKQIGHFTQLVWKNTKEVGFGTARAASGGVYVVANYYPPGNVQGYYTSNVFPPK